MNFVIETEKSECLFLLESFFEFLAVQASSVKQLWPDRDNKYLSWVYGVDRKICHEDH